MSPALAPVLVLQTLIAVRPTEASCPSPRQVSEAIAARLPGLLVPPEQSGAPDTLTLVLGAEAGALHGFALVDRDARVRLRRELPPSMGGPDECPALAETVALMVERYLQDLAYNADSMGGFEGRRWELFAGAGWRPGADGAAAYELRLGAGRAFGRGRWALALVAGVEGAADQVWPGATGQLRRFPFEARLAWRAPMGPIWLEAGPFAGAHLLWLNSQAAERTASSHRVIPVAGAGAGLRIPLGRSTFVRAEASLGVAVLRYDFVTADPGQTVQFGTDLLWGKMAIEAGFAFW